MRCNPVLSKVLEPGAPRRIVDPLSATLIGFDRCQPPIGVRLCTEGVGSSPPGSVGSGERCLPSARRKFANTAKSSTAHSLPLLLFGSGGTSPSARKASRSVDKMRTCLPTLKKRMRRSAMSRRMKRVEVPSRAAAASGASSSARGCPFIVRSRSCWRLALDIARAVSSWPRIGSCWLVRVWPRVRRSARASRTRAGSGPVSRRNLDGMSLSRSKLLRVV